MKKEMYVLVGLSVLSLLFLFIGCGTDPTDENQFLEGEYIFAAYGLDDSVPFASIQTMSFQANNELQYDTIYSSQGDGDSGTIPYTLTGEGTLHIEDWEGQVSPDCELIGLIDQEVMVNSYVAIGIGFR